MGYAEQQQRWPMTASAADRATPTRSEGIPPLAGHATLPRETVDYRRRLGPTRPQGPTHLLADGTVTAFTGPTAIADYVVPTITRAAVGRPASRVEVRRYADAGATEFVASVTGSATDRARTIEVLGGLAAAGVTLVG
jgi:hypothetical protein